MKYDKTAEDVVGVISYKHTRNAAIGINIKLHFSSDTKIVVLL